MGTLIKAGRLQEAILAGEEELRGGSVDVEVRLGLARAYWALARGESAARLIDSSDPDGRHPELLPLRAEIALVRQEPGAARFLQRLRQVSPQHPLLKHPPQSDQPPAGDGVEAWLAGAEYHLRRGELADAEPLLLKAEASAVGLARASALRWAWTQERHLGAVPPEVEDVLEAALAAGGEVSEQEEGSEEAVASSLGGQPVASSIQGEDLAHSGEWPGEASVAPDNHEQQAVPPPEASLEEMVIEAGSEEDEEHSGDLFLLPHGIGAISLNIPVTSQQFFGNEDDEVVVIERTGRARRLGDGYDTWFRGESPVPKTAPTATTTPYDPALGRYGFEDEDEIATEVVTITPDGRILPLRRGSEKLMPDTELDEDQEIIIPSQRTLPPAGIPIPQEVLAEGKGRAGAVRPPARDALLANLEQALNATGSDGAGGAELSVAEEALRRGRLEENLASVLGGGGRDDGIATPGFRVLSSPALPPQARPADPATEETRVQPTGPLGDELGLEPDEGDSLSGQPTVIRLKAEDEGPAARLAPTPAPPLVPSAPPPLTGPPVPAMPGQNAPSRELSSANDKPEEAPAPRPAPVVGPTRTPAPTFTFGARKTVTKKYSNPPNLPAASKGPNPPAAPRPPLSTQGAQTKQAYFQKSAFQPRKTGTIWVVGGVIIVVGAMLAYAGYRVKRTEALFNLKEDVRAALAAGRPDRLQPALKDIKASPDAADPELSAYTTEINWILYAQYGIKPEGANLDPATLDAVTADSPIGMIVARGERDLLRGDVIQGEAIAKKAFEKKENEKEPALATLVARFALARAGEEKSLMDKAADRFVAAVETFERAAPEAHPMPKSLIYIGYSLAYPVGAKFNLQAAVQNDEKNFWAQLYSGMASIAPDATFEDADTQLKKLLTDNQAVLTPRQIAAVHLERGRRALLNTVVDPAIEAFKAALEADPENIEAGWRLGQVYSDIGKVAPAIEQLEKTIKLAPFDMRVIQVYAGALLQANQVAKAKDLINQVPAAYQDSPYARLVKARIQRATNQLTGADAQIAEAQKERPEDFDLKVEAAMLKLAANAADAGAALSALVIPANTIGRPGVSPVLTAYAATLAPEKDRVKTMTDALGPADGNAAAMTILAEGLLAAGDAKAAETALTGAQKVGDLPRMDLLLARILADQPDKKAQAAELARKVQGRCGEGPTCDEAAKLVEKLR